MKTLKQLINEITSAVERGGYKVQTDDNDISVFYKGKKIADGTGRNGSREVVINIGGEQKKFKKDTEALNYFIDNKITSTNDTSLDYQYKSKVMPKISADKVKGLLSRVKTLKEFNFFLAISVYKTSRGLKDIHRGIKGLYVDHGSYYSTYYYEIDYLKWLGVDPNLFKKWFAGEMKQWKIDTKEAENDKSLKVGPKPTMSTSGDKIIVSIPGTLITPQDPNYYHDNALPIREKFDIKKNK